MYDVGKRVAEIKLLETRYEAVVSQHNELLGMKSLAEKMATEYFRQVAQALHIRIEDARCFIVNGISIEMDTQKKLAQQLMDEIKKKVDERYITN